MTSFTFIHVDFSLEGLDLLLLRLSKLLDPVLLLLKSRLLLLVLIVEDGLVGVRELVVKFKLPLTKLPNQVQETSVTFHVIGQLTLGVIKFGLGFLNVSEAFLLSLLELVLKLQNDSRRSTNLKSLQLNGVSEPQHTFLVVSPLLLSLDLVMLLDLLLLAGHGYLVGL